MRVKSNIKNILLALISILVIIGIILDFKLNNRYDKLLTVDQPVEETTVITTEEEKKEETTTEQVEETTQEEITTTTVPEPVKEEPVVAKADEHGDVIYSFLTHYGPDCAGCGGTTASGYNVRNTIYYNDSTYGQVRIVAMSKNYPLYSIIRLNNYKKGTITAIVLDRGGAITGNKIDLLVSSESEASNLGIQRNVEVEVLRWGK